MKPFKRLISQCVRYTGLKSGVNETAFPVDWIGATRERYASG